MSKSLKLNCRKCVIFFFSILFVSINIRYITDTWNASYHYSANITHINKTKVENKRNLFFNNPELTKVELCDTFKRCFTQSFNYIIMKKCRYSSEVKEVVFVIISASEHVTHREEMRQKLHFGGAQYQNMEYVFLLGISNTTSVNTDILSESQTYQDIVQVDVIDTYRNLTLKSIYMLHWVQTHCNNVKSVLKMDDDVSFNLHQIFQQLSKIRIPIEGLITGNIAYHSFPVRDNSSKWYLPPHEFNQSKFPEFAIGPSYLLSGNAVTTLLKSTDQVPYLWLEDVYLTGLLRKHSGVKLAKSGLFFCQSFETVTLNCPLVHGKYISKEFYSDNYLYLDSTWMFICFTGVIIFCCTGGM